MVNCTNISKAPQGKLTVLQQLSHLEFDFAEQWGVSPMKKWRASGTSKNIFLLMEI